MPPYNSNNSNDYHCILCLVLKYVYMKYQDVNTQFRSYLCFTSVQNPYGLIYLIGHGAVVKSVVVVVVTDVVVVVKNLQLQALPRGRATVVARVTTADHVPA